MDKSTSWVAVVDDEALLRRVIMRVLRLAKIPAREFSSGVSFLAEFDSLAPAPACVLLDIVLPDMNGIEVCAQLRQRAPDLPVILMSGNITPAAPFPPNPGAVVNFLEKPIHSAVLLDAVRAALEKYPVRARQ